PGGEGEWEPLPLGGAVGTGEIRLLKQRRRRALPIQAPRSIPNHAEVAEVAGAQIVNTVRCTNTAVPRTAEEPGEETGGRRRRIGHANAGSESIPLGGRDGAGHSGVAGDQIAERRG